jgi:hypothetical protein
MSVCAPIITDKVIGLRGVRTPILPVPVLEIVTAMIFLDSVMMSLMKDNRGPLNCMNAIYQRPVILDTIICECPPARVCPPIVIEALLPKIIESFIHCT